MQKNRLLGLLLICIGILLGITQWICWEFLGVWVFVFPFPFIPFLILIGLGSIILGFKMLLTGKEFEEE